MRLHFTLLFLLVSSTIWSQIPELLSEMINKYPSAYRRVWYYYDHQNADQYYRIQFSAQRTQLSSSEVDRLTDSYLSAFNHNDFSKDEGVLYRSPDSTSVTIKGPVALSFDLGPKNIAADWGEKKSGIRKWVKPDFRTLVAAFNQVAKGKRVKKTEVSYTGFSHGITFTFHRGQGKGLTKGVRTTIYNATPADYEKLRQAIRAFIGKATPVTVFDRTWQAMVKSETTPLFYAVGYNPTTKVLNFLQATVENEICIPLDWQTIDRIPKK